MWISLLILQQFLNLSAQDFCPYENTKLEKSIGLDETFWKKTKKDFGCQIFQRKKFSERRADLKGPGGKLTYFWAQELASVDLANDLMENLQDKKNVLREVPVGLYDEGFSLSMIPPDRFSGQAKKCRAAVKACNPGTADLVSAGLNIDQIEQMMNDRSGPLFKTCPAMEKDCPKNINRRKNHGTLVANLIAGQKPFGSGIKSTISHVEPLIENFDQSPSLAKRFSSGEKTPELINVSMGCGKDIDRQKYCDGLKQNLEELAKKSIVVKSAGNDFPIPLDASAQANGVIVVGALNPSGLISHFSSSGEGITINAPSDKFMQSMGPDDNDSDEGSGASKKSFGGTSGAAAMVTGIVSNVLSLLPGITNDELKVMIKNTAFHTSGTDGSCGSINAYKLTQVAYDLKCKGWPGSRDALHSLETYNYEKKSEALRQKAVNNLLGPVTDKKNMCQHYENAMQLLRKSIYLNPNNVAARTMLADIYKSQGYGAQANFVAPPDSVKSITGQYGDPYIRAKSRLRYGFLLMQDLDTIESYFTGTIPASPHDIRQETLAKGFFGLDGPSQLRIFDKLFVDDPESKKRFVTYILTMPLAAELPGINALIGHYLKQIKNGKDEILSLTQKSGLHL